MTTTIRNVTLSVPPDEIDDLCAAHAALDFSPSLELGSEKSGAGAPRFGSVTNLRNAGGKLTVDLEVADERVAKAILAKGSGRVRSAIYEHLRRGAKVFRRALKSVSLIDIAPPPLPQLVPSTVQQFAGAAVSLQAAASYELSVDEGDPREVLHQRTLRYREAHPETKTYAAAMEAVLAEDEALARAYAAGDGRRSADTAGSPWERVPDQAAAAIDRGEAGAEVHRLSLELMRSNPSMTYADAMQRVLTDRPELRRAYRGVSDAQLG